MPWPSLPTTGGWASTPTSAGFASPAGSTVNRGSAGMGLGGGFSGTSGGIGSSSMGSGATGAAISNASTWGHDTHPTWEDPEEERDPSQGLYHDRRSEGRRHTPVIKHVRTNGHSSLPKGVKFSPDTRKRMLVEQSGVFATGGYSEN